MASMVNVSVDRGFLRVIGEISVSSSKKELESFVAEINWQLLGDRKCPQTPSCGVVAKELTEAEAAVYIGRSKSFLRRCRSEGKGKRRPSGPKYRRDGKRSIRYPIVELDKWLASRELYETTGEEEWGDDE